MDGVAEILFEQAKAIIDADAPTCDDVEASIKILELVVKSLKPSNACFIGPAYCGGSGCVGVANQPTKKAHRR